MLTGVLKNYLGVPANPYRDGESRSFVGVPSSPPTDKLISPEVTFSLNLRDVWRSIREGKLESDPHATLEQRWGISADEYTPRCRTYGEG